MLYLLYKVWIQYFFLIPIVQPQQWGNALSINGLYTLIFPIAFRNKPFIVNCSEHSAQGWNNQVAIPGAHASYATNKDVLIYTRWVTSDGKVISNKGQNFEYFSIGL